jgi:hypothetical protein
MMIFPEQEIRDSIDSASHLDLCQTIFNEVVSKRPVQINMIDGTNLILKTEEEAKAKLEKHFSWVPDPP